MEWDRPADLTTVDLLAISEKYLSNLDLYNVTKEVTKERTLATERKKKGVKKSLMETKALQNKNIISAFKDGRAPLSLRGRGFARSTFRPDPFRTRPPNTSRPPSLHVDDFLVLELKGQQPTGPTGYNKQSIKAAKELFAQREAEAALKPPVQLREATREPVGLNRSRGRGGFRGRGGESGGGRSLQTGFRRDSRGWSPEPGQQFRTSEPREAGRTGPGAGSGARPSEERRGGRGGGGRGERRGQGGGSGAGRAERRFGRPGREDRSRQLRNLTR